MRSALGDRAADGQHPHAGGVLPAVQLHASAWPLSDQWFWNTTSTAPVTWVYDDIFGPLLTARYTQP